jgi:hypothetical protein
MVRIRHDLYEESKIRSGGRVYKYSSGHWDEKNARAVAKQMRENHGLRAKVIPVDNGHGIRYQVYTNKPRTVK